MRKFGIELEMVAPRTARSDALTFARDTLAAIGLRARTNAYSGRDYGQWQVKPDGSIHGGDGAEVVSRIMPANESSYDEIRRAVQALKEAGFGINRSCGFHCHISVADLPMTVRKLIVLRYAQLQGPISAMLPPSRRANGYCEVLGQARFDQLARDIDTRGNGGFPFHTRGVCNTGHAEMTAGDNARIEFRQAAGTVEPAKVIAWVRFLQEFIDEVARRANGVTFGDSRIAVRPAPTPVWTPRPTPPFPVAANPVAANPLASVPRNRVGSDAERAETQLRTAGALSAAWAAGQGIAEPVLRRIVVGMRRHGAQITTHRNPLVYTVDGAHTLPISRTALYLSAQTPAIAPPAPVAPAPVAPPSPVPTTQRAATFVDYPFSAGLSDATMRWVMERAQTFNANLSLYVAPTRDAEDAAA